MDLLNDLRLHAGTWFDTSDRIDFYAAVLFALAILVFRKPIASFLMARLNALFHRLSITLSADVTKQLTNAAVILLAVFAVFVGLEVTSLPDLLDSIVRRLCTSVAIVAVFATWHGLCGPFVELLQGSAPNTTTTEKQWVERVAQFAIVILGIAALLKVWEVDISSAMTGVGVMGAGLAIAAQDLVRNLVAGMTNINEKRFVIGDAIEVDGVLAGTVEQIDLRSTTVRGFDQIPRYVPNAELSNAVVKNYGQLYHRRVMTTIQLILSTSEAQVLQIRDGLRDYLSDSGDFDLSEAAPRYVVIEGVSSYSLDILFYARTTTPDYGAWLDVKERFSLKVLQLVEEAGTSLAFPTQTIFAEPGIIASDASDT